MYLRLTNGFPNQSFISGVEEFVQFALSRPEGSDGNHIRCPCKKKKCQNKNFVEVNKAKFHLYKYGFVPNYRVWYLHGETESSIYGEEALYNVNATNHHVITNNVGSLTTFVQMVYDAADP